MGAVAEDRLRRAKRRKAVLAEQYSAAVRAGDRVKQEELYNKWVQADVVMDAAYRKVREQRNVP